MNRVGPQTIDDVLRTVCMIVKKRDEDDHVCLTVSPSPGLQNGDHCADHFVRPGLWRQRASSAQLKWAALSLRKLGYYVDLFAQDELAKWYASFDALPVDPDDVHRAERGRVEAALPECQTYVELFGAGESLLAVRRPSMVEVYNDFSQQVVNFFAVLRSPETFASFFLLSRLFPVVTPLDRLALRSYIQGIPDLDPVLRAYAWYCNLRPDHPTYMLTGKGSSEEARVTEALAAVDDAFPWVRHRLIRVQYEFNPWQKIVEIYDSQGTLFWVDVPNRGPEALTEENTSILVAALNDVSGAVAVYIDHSDPNETVAKLLRREARRKGSSWRSKKYKTCTVFQKPNR